MPIEPRSNPIACGSFFCLLASGGLRWGEAAAQGRQRCGLSPSGIEVAESLADAAVIASVTIPKR